MPIRFRKKVLNAYPLRRERSQNFDNNNANTNFWIPKGLPLPALIWTENWPYALNDMTTVNTGNNWTVSTNIHTTPYAQMGNPVGQVNMSLSGFAGFSNNVNFARGSVNKGFKWAMQLTVSNLTAGTTGDFGEGNGIFLQMGASNGFTIQNRNAAGFVELIHRADGAVKGTYNLGAGPYSGTITIIGDPVALKSDLYNGSTKVGSVAMAAEAAGLTTISGASNMVNGNGAGLGCIMKTISLFGTAV